MLNVKTPEEVLEIINREFFPLNISERAGLDEAAGRVLAEDIKASEYVPDFNRSTVDGYALSSKDTFGCSESIPAILPLRGEILMGTGADFVLPEGECCYVPTGGEIPNGADCAVMLEYSENYGDGTIGISKPGAPGLNMIYRGDDVYPGKTVLEKGRVISAQDIGALSAIGCTEIPVIKRLRVGIISTGDELVPPEEKPSAGQVRDVNAPMLKAMYSLFGAEVISYGIIKDDEEALKKAVEKGIDECDALVLSGGSSVGTKDASCRIIEALGELLLHGIAIKPGKPTIMGKCSGKPVIGLPGHPVAAYFISRLFVLPLFARLEGRTYNTYTVTAYLTESMSANHGRAQYSGVKLVKNGDVLNALPVRSKSGLISSLAGAEGYFCIERDCEGLPAGAEIQVTICEGK